MALGLISVDDGSLRVLKSENWRGALEMFFSPDGKYLGFDEPVGERNQQRDVFILAVDGSRETPAVISPNEDRMMGWSVDGKHLLFASDRSGALGLWALPVRGGLPEASPHMVKPDIGSTSLGLSARGDLYSGLHVGGPDIHVASLDLARGDLIDGPAGVVTAFVGTNEQPDWSPDGKSLAYLSLRNQAGLKNVLAIQSMETGEVRELQPALNYFDGPDWTPDGRSLIMRGRDLKNRRGVYRVDAQTGDATLVFALEHGGAVFGPQWSPDGKKIYYRDAIGDSNPNQYALFERNLETGIAREIIRQPLVLGVPNVSPDGRFIAAASGIGSVLVISVADGSSREVIRDRENGVQLRGIAWTPDGRSLVINKMSTDKGDQRELVILSIADGKTRRLDVPAVACCDIKVHPDGRQIAFPSGQGRGEVWVLENFLPR